MPTYKGIGQPFDCSARATVIISAYALAAHRIVNPGHLILKRVPTPGCSFYRNEETLCLVLPHRKKKAPPQVILARRFPESHDKRGKLSCQRHQHLQTRRIIILLRRDLRLARRELAHRQITHRQ